MRSTHLPSPTVHALGYAGLLPFLGLAVAVWFGPAGYRALAATALLGYGASILSFLGAIHWGLGMRDATPAGLSLWAWGVTPSLIAWVALLVAPPMGLGLIAGGLTVCLLVDIRVYSRMHLEAWLPMRMILTTVAVTCCLGGAWGAAV